jgi:hypothetical protein
MEASKKRLDAVSTSKKRPAKAACIINDREPEPSGEEGMQDVRIVQALYQSSKTRKPISLRPVAKRQRPTGRQRMSRPGVEKPALIKVQSASQD